MPQVQELGSTADQTRVERTERSAMKNGFRPYVFEKHGLYKGNWQNDIKQGKGKKLYLNKTVYEGDWVGNKRHGFGVLMKKTDDCFVFVYEGQWINNRFAKGKCYEKNGVYEGNFSTASSRVKCGYGTMRWIDGTVYQGQWRNNEYNGRGLLAEANGRIYDGQWRNGVKHGEGLYVFKDKGQYMEGVWIDGVPRLSIIKCLDDLDLDSSVGRSLFTAQQCTKIPELSKSDEESIRKAYENRKSEILNSLV